LIPPPPPSPPLFPYTTLFRSIEAGDNSDAAACDLVVIATPWDSAATTAQEQADSLAGKVVVCMANALIMVGGEFQPLVPPRGSRSEEHTSELQSQSNLVCRLL